MKMTSINLPDDMIQAAKLNKINMTETLKEALALKLGGSVQKKEIEDKILEHEKQIMSLKNSLKGITEKQNVEKQQDFQKEYDDNIIALKHYKKKMIEGRITNETFNAMIKKVALSFDKSVQEVVDRVNSSSALFVADSGVKE